MATNGPSVKPGKFKVPPNYNLVDIGDKNEPWLEDLEDDDVEIWIMQTPPNVDLSKIQGQPMKLEGSTYFDCEGFYGNKLESFIIPNTASNGLHCNLIAPARDDKKYHVVKKPFAGHIMLTESFDLPECQAPEDHFDERMDHPENPKQRFFPFGSYFVERNTSTASRKKKRSKKSGIPKDIKIEFSSDAEVESHLEVHNSNGKSTSKYDFKPESLPEVLKPNHTEDRGDDGFPVDQSTLPMDVEISASGGKKKKKKKKDSFRHTFSPDEENPEKDSVSRKSKGGKFKQSDAGNETEQLSADPSSGQGAESTVYSSGKRRGLETQFPATEVRGVKEEVKSEKEELTTNRNVLDVREGKSKNKWESSYSAGWELGSEPGQSTLAGDSSETTEDLRIRKKKKKKKSSCSLDSPGLVMKSKKSKRKSDRISVSTASSDTEAYPDDPGKQTFEGTSGNWNELVPPAIEGSKKEVPDSSEDICTKKKKKKKEKAGTSEMEKKSIQMAVSSTASSDTEALSRGKCKFEKLLQNLKQEPSSPSSRNSSEDRSRKKKKKKSTSRDHEETVVKKSSEDNFHIQDYSQPHTSNFFEEPTSQGTGIKKSKKKIKQEPLTPVKSKRHNSGKESYNPAVVKEEKISDSGSDSHANMFSSPFNDKKHIKTEDVKPCLPDVPIVAVQGTSYELPKEFIKKSKSSKKKSLKREPLSP